MLSHTLMVVGLGSGLLGLVSGSLGSYAVLRRQSLLGDAISHAALPGIALAFLLTGSKEVLPLMAGAAAAGIVGTLIVSGIVNSSRVKDDSALGIVLSVFFGLGIVLLTYIQKLPSAAQAGLDKFLFGQAAALLERDIWVISGLGLVVLTSVALFWKEFKLLSFDPDFGASLGFSMRKIEMLMTILLVLAIVLGLQTVGVVLMSAMVVAPAAAARQWTNKLGKMVILSGLFGAVSGISGAVVSSVMTRMPTGPTIVICVTVLLVASLLFAPGRGIVAAILRHRRNQYRLRVGAVLADLYELALQHKGLQHPHTVEAIAAMSFGHGRSGVEKTLIELASCGWARHTPDGWLLTNEGVRAAQTLNFQPSETLSGETRA